MEPIFNPNTIPKDTLVAARKLLDSNAMRMQINPQRAASALGLSSVSIGNEKIHVGYPLDNYQNLILSFDDTADIDQNGNPISPIFETQAADGSLPLWYKFFQAFQAANFKDLDESKSLTLTKVYFGTYTQEKNAHFFSVKKTPIEADHILMGFKGDYDKLSIFIKGSIILIGDRYPRSNSLIYVIAPVEPDIYQKYYEDLRLQEAVKIVEARQAERCSLRSHDAGFRYIIDNYPDHIADFRFEQESFRFSGFNVKFYYDQESLKKFDDFYHHVYLPYIEEELEKRQWKAIADEIERRLKRKFRNGMVENNVRYINFKKVRDTCLVESDLVDDYTGKNFHFMVKSHDPDEIYQATETEFIRIFRYKRQLKEIGIILRRLSTKNPA